MSYDFIWPEVRALLDKRRGRLHAYEALEPTRTALIVIDMRRPSSIPGRRPTYRQPGPSYRL